MATIEKIGWVDQMWKTTSRGRRVNITTVNSATYDLLVTDHFVHVTYTAIGAVTSLTLPTAQLLEGRSIVIKDAGRSSTTNNITIDTEGAETIEGKSEYIIKGDGDSISFYSDGSNWYVDRAYTNNCVGVMYAYDANATVTINQVDLYHAVSGVFSEGTANDGFTFLAGATGAITDTANNGGILRCTDVGHGLTTGQYVTLNSMGDIAHNGITEVTVIDADTFDCENITYSSDNDTGDWQRGDSLTCEFGCGGLYTGGFSISASSAVASKNYKFEIYANTTPYDEFVWERLFGNTGWGVGSTAGVGEFKAGDVIWLAVKNTTDAQNVVINHANFNAHRQ